MHNKLFAPVMEQSERTNMEITNRMETTEKAMVSTHQALQNFSEAMAEYAVHLKSHTSAIQGLSEASQELKKGAGEQNRVLSTLVQRLEQVPSSVEPRAKEIIVREKGKPPLEQITKPAGTDQVIIEVQVSPKIEPVIAWEPNHSPTTAWVQQSSEEEVVAEPEGDNYPPGCFQVHREPPKKLTLAEKQNLILRRGKEEENSEAEVQRSSDRKNITRPHPTVQKKLIARKNDAGTRRTRSTE